MKNTTVAAQLNGGPMDAYTDSDLSGVEEFLGISKVTKRALLKEVLCQESYGLYIIIVAILSE